MRARARGRRAGRAAGDSGGCPSRRPIGPCDTRRGARPLPLSQLVTGEVTADHPQPLQAVKLLARLRSGAIDADAAQEQLHAWLADGGAGAGDATTRCVAAARALSSGDAAGALRAVHGCADPEARALAVQALLAADRPDLAERGAAALAGADDDGAASSLAAAWVGVVLGGRRAQEAATIFEELGERFAWTPRLAAGAAAAALRMNDPDAAERHLLDAHAKDARAADVLANLAVAASHGGKPSGRWLAALRAAAPSHPIVARLDAAADAFDRAATEYAVPQGAAA
jgi:coatomer protein complex subunit epsilon